MFRKAIQSTFIVMLFSATVSHAESNNIYIKDVCPYPKAWEKIPEDADQMCINMSWNNQNMSTYLKSWADVKCTELQLNMAKQMCGQDFYDGALEVCKCVDSYTSGKDSKNIDTFNENVQSTIDGYGIQGIDKYDVLGIKLGMSDKDAAKILKDSGYASVGGNYSKNVDGITKNVKFGHAREAESNKLVVTEITYNQNFPGSVKLDPQAIHEQLVSKYGEPQKDKWMGDKGFNMKHVAGDVELTSSVFQRRVTVYLKSNELHKAINSAAHEYNTARRLKDEKSKSTVRPEF